MKQEYQKLDYEIYDRQMEIFCNALELFIEGYREYSASELSMDIRSLCIKASRLCYMADQDYAIQQETLIDERLAQNTTQLDRLGYLINTKFSQMVESVIQNIRNTKSFDGVKLPRLEGEFADILPNISKYIFEDRDTEQLENMYELTQKCQNAINNEKKASNAHGEKSIVRFWNLSNLYAYTCYLYYHFKRLNYHKTADIDEEQLKRLFILSLNNYKDSEEGQRNIETFIGLLNFQSKGSIPKEKLRTIGTELVNDIPQNLKLCYINHRDEPEKIAGEIMKIKPSANELTALADALNKWAIIKSIINSIDNPKKYKTDKNNIFRTEINGIFTDFSVLRAKINRMQGLITAKNQWFCVWCVLKHHNLLADTHFEAFATQMMSKDWFSNTNYFITGDNLSDYSNYFGETDFMRWNYEDFKTYRATHKKSEKKWSDKLFEKFKRLCFEMNEVFEESE